MGRGLPIGPTIFSRGPSWRWLDFAVIGPNIPAKLRKGPRTKQIEKTEKR